MTSLRNCYFHLGHGENIIFRLENNFLSRPNNKRFRNVTCVVYCFTLIFLVPVKLSRHPINFGLQKSRRLSCLILRIDKELLVRMDKEEPAIVEINISKILDDFFATKVLKIKHVIKKTIQTHTNQM